MSKIMRGRPKDQDKATAILDAAGLQFTQHGLRGTTMQSIAEQANVSKFTVYNHFGSKEELFNKVIEHKCSAHLSDDLQIIVFDKAPKEALIDIAMGFIGIIYSEEALNLHRTIAAESRHDDQIARMFYNSGPERVFRIIGSFLQNLQHKGLADIDNIQDAAETFTSLIMGAAHMRAVFGLQNMSDQTQREHFARQKVTYFMRIYNIN